MLSIAGNTGGRSLGRSYKLVIDNQQPKVEAGNETLTNHASRNPFSGLQSHLGIFPVLNVDGCSTSVIAIHRLEDYRVANARNGIFQIFFVVNDIAFRHRNSGSIENVFGFFLVAGNLHRNVRGCRCNCCLNSLLIYAITELHK